ncbi:MAG: stage II sporulation protein D [Oscillospiraceae bacterium]|nr:stage II sporulation protein D [Oscillospiraceae bacterium]
MKQMWKQIGTAAVMGLLVPGVILSLAVAFTDREKQPETVVSISQTSMPAETDTLVQAAPSLLISVLLDDETVSEMELDEYLVGVVLAEMPVSFETEAHKSQAVVARTYALKRSTSQPKHSGGAVCTDSSCCQGYLSPEDYLAKGGTQEEINQIREAVQDTSGLVLTYEGELIEATYFSCSGGSTEDALAVWGTDIPYLQSTSSPGEENASHYTDTVYFSKDEFASALGVNLSGSAVGWLGSVTYTEGGGVNTMEIGGTVYKGTTLRQLLGLRSTAFTMMATEDGISITTRGFGHRVGMSQYGADAMAVSGSTYEEILAHYYEGAELVNYIPNNN